MGSSSRTQRAVGEHHPRQGEPGALSGRERLRRPRRQGALRPSGRVATSSARATAPGPPDLGVGRASGARPAGCRRCVPAHEPGPLGQPGDVRLPRGRGIAARRSAVDPDRPASGSSPGERRRAASTSRQPDGPVTAVIPVPGSVAERRSRAGAAVRVADAARPRARAAPARRPGPGAESRSAPVRTRSARRGLERRGALGRGVELRADPAQRPVGLGCQQQHDQRGSRSRRRAASRRPTVHRDQRDRERGDSSSTAEEANAIRSVSRWPAGSAR